MVREYLINKIKTIQLKIKHKIYNLKYHNKYLTDKLIKLSIINRLNINELKNKVYHSDCIEYLRLIPDNSIDFICIDPPYIVDGRMRSKVEYDNAIHITYSNDLLLHELYRVTKKQSTIAIFGHLPFQAQIFNSEFNMFEYVMEIICINHQPKNFFMCYNKPLSQHETITLWKKKKLNYNYEEAKVYGFDAYIKGEKRNHNTLYFNNIKWYSENTDGSRYMSSTMNNKIYQNRERYMPSFVHIKNKPGFKPEDRTEHPTQKDLQLYNKLVKSFSFEGQNCLDCFVGSGNLALACKLNNRNYFVCDNDERYINLTKNRLEQINVSDVSNIKITNKQSEQTILGM